MKLEKCLRKILLETKSSEDMVFTKYKNCMHNCLGINMKDICPHYLSQDKLSELREYNYLK